MNELHIVLKRLLMSMEVFLTHSIHRPRILEWIPSLGEVNRHHLLIWTSEMCRSLYRRSLAMRSTWIGRIRGHRSLWISLWSLAVRSARRMGSSRIRVLSGWSRGWLILWILLPGVDLSEQQAFTGNSKAVSNRKSTAYLQCSHIRNLHIRRHNMVEEVKQINVLIVYEYSVVVVSMSWIENVYFRRLLYSRSGL